MGINKWWKEEIEEGRTRDTILNFSQASDLVLEKLGKTFMSLK